MIQNWRFVVERQFFFSSVKERDNSEIYEKTTKCKEMKISQRKENHDLNKSKQNPEKQLIELNLPATKAKRGTYE